MCVRERIPLGALLKLSLLCFLEPAECHVGQNTVLVAFGIRPRRSWLFWSRLVFYLVGVGHGSSASHHGQLSNTTRPRRVYHADANVSLPSPADVTPVIFFLGFIMETPDEVMTEGESTEVNLEVDQASMIEVARAWIVEKGWPEARYRVEISTVQSCPPG